MSDADFEFISASEIVVSRKRKPKYVHRLWEANSDAHLYQYYAALQRSYSRRHKTSDTPYDHFIDERQSYIEWWIKNTLPDPEYVEYKSKPIDKCYCDNCDAFVDKDECSEIEWYMICDSCSDEGLFVCQSCFNICNVDQLSDSSDDEMVCEDCSER